MKKDDYLMTTMQVPPKQRIAITPFDLRTQRDAFSVSLDGLKGVRFPLTLDLSTKLLWLLSSYDLTLISTHTVEHQRTCG